MQAMEKGEYKMKDMKQNALREDELEQVTGGTYFETTDDFRRCKELGIVGRHDTDWSKMRDNIQQYGFWMKDHGGFTANHYYRTGSNQEVSREQMWREIYRQKNRPFHGL